MSRSIAGMILAGGRSSRMGGGDKTLLPLGNGTVLDEVTRRLRPQLDTLALNANGDPERFASFDLPVLPDTFGSFEGPLAGILTGLLWAEKIGVENLITVAGDTPFLPNELVSRLQAAAPSSSIAVATSNARIHPTFALWPVALRSDLETFLHTQASRRVNHFISDHPHVRVAFDTASFDPFFNINTPDDLVEAQRLAASLS
ncbi:molybdenum cofactor guanylyltransferase MobA [Tianweitania sp. BSSL-BM11]|uniref:Molybdenum cofactor guanylyltransferase n=1 Tax=Tianweitania aestuarii TaxID=2814886 RepID=A0ABS5RX12_9HYPH|nr:molybdenum cofactor guanylyltransferase MobA [Tianweitania aestuarii]MBS9720749.1 molybdenum cofactor guanylyltransferase MobA [Tianweitania aestuarii]